MAPNSTYGLGAVTGSRGGAFSDLVRVPFADGMLVRLPDGVSPPSVAAASDNLTNAFEAVVPLSLLQMVLRGVRLEATPMDIRAFLPEVLSLVRTGRIVPERVTTEVLSWETLPEALVEPSTKPVFVR